MVNCYRYVFTASAALRPILFFASVRAKARRHSMHLSRRGPEVRRCAAQQAHRSEFHSVTTRTSVHQCTCMHEVHSGRMVYRRPVWHRLHDFPLNVEAFVLKHVNLVCTGRVTVARCTLAQCGRQSYKSPLHTRMLLRRHANIV
jgi:hypothetical protein